MTYERRPYVVANHQPPYLLWFDGRQVYRSTDVTRRDARFIDWYRYFYIVPDISSPRSATVSVESHGGIYGNMTTDGAKRGVLYMASGAQYVEEARISARSVRENMPGVETAIATPDTHLDLSVFDRVIEREARTRVVNGRDWLIDSTVPPDLSPYEKTLFLDSDTYVYTDVSELFDLLDRFDMAFARTPNKNGIDGLPDPWWEYNCGVIAYRDSASTRAFLAEWERRYRERIETQAEPKDQLAFAHTLYESDVDFFTLPQEYNVRCDRRGALGREAKIIHGRHRAGIEQVAEELNTVTHLRVFRERSHLFSPTQVIKGRETYRYYIEKTFAEDGARMVVLRAGAHVVDRIFGTEFQDRTYEGRR